MAEYINLTSLEKLNVGDKIVYRSTQELHLSGTDSFAYTGPWERNISFPKYNGIRQAYLEMLGPARATIGVAPSSYSSFGQSGGKVYGQLLNMDSETSPASIKVVSEALKPISDDSIGDMYLTTSDEENSFLRIESISQGLVSVSNGDYATSAQKNTVSYTENSYFNYITFYEDWGKSFNSQTTNTTYPRNGIAGELILTIEKIQERPVIRINREFNALETLKSSDFSITFLNEDGVETNYSYTIREAYFNNGTSTCIGTDTQLTFVLDVIISGKKVEMRETVNVIVNKLTPQLPDLSIKIDIKYPSELPELIPDGITLTESIPEFKQLKLYKIKGIFTPKDTINYKVMNIELLVTVVNTFLQTISNKYDISKFKKTRLKIYKDGQWKEGLPRIF